MNPKVRHGLIGAAAGLLIVMAAGALRGAFFGNGDDYALRLKGFDGAILGAILFAVFGGVPAALLGAVAGVCVGVYRGRAAKPSQAEPDAATSGRAGELGRDSTEGRLTGSDGPSIT